ncbi:MAG: STAS domain-containing protein [Hyphomicrobiales bacterium]|nr:STAS domain-containing protein [Hyphomicrobiales bacterium]
MGKESVWQRRARKHGASKADYYPKVDLSDRADALEQIEGLATVEPAEQSEAPVPHEALATAEPAPSDFPPSDLAQSDLAQSDLAPVDETPAPLAEPEAAVPAPEEEAEPLAALVADAPAAPEAETAIADDAIRLPEFLDLAAARPLAKILLERRGTPIVIDGSAVNQVGAQCVQVLLSAKKTWSADGVALSLVNCAPRMVEDLHHLGIDPATLMSGALAQ